MSNRQEAAERVAAMINEAERAMDYAMAKTSALVTELPNLQIEAGLNASWAQPVIVSVCSALGEMTAARGSIIGAHKSLSAIQRKLGIVMIEPANNPKAYSEGFVPLAGRDSERVIALRA